MWCQMRENRPLGDVLKAQVIAPWQLAHDDLLLAEPSPAPVEQLVVERHVGRSDQNGSHGRLDD